MDFRELRKHRNIQEREEYLKSLLEGLRKQKSLGFSFERECRLAIDLRNEKTCEFRDGDYYWKLPSDLLKRVILGFRCPLEESPVQELLNKKGFLNAKVIRAKMCSETYSIICDDNSVN